MKEFKYKTLFAFNKIAPLDSNKGESLVAFASKSDKIKKLLPKGLNISDNIGFQLFTAEAFIANKLNANFDGVKNREAIQLKNQFPLGFCDLNHKRDHIIGVIVDSAYTDFNTGKELLEKDVKEMTKPFSVTLTGIIWRAANPELADAIGSCNDRNSEYYNKLYLSWEVGFDQVNLITMKDGETDFSKGALITDETEIEKLKPRMLSEGGNGFTEDGLKIGRVPYGKDVCALGVGIVENPAGQVNPLSVPDDNANKENVEQLESSKNMDNIINKETSEKDAVPKKIDTIDIYKSAYPKPIRKLYKKFQKSKITEADFADQLAGLVNAYAVSLSASGLEFSDDLGKCPSCETVNPEDSTRYDNGKIFCGKCGGLSVGSKWNNDKKIKMGDEAEDLYKIVELQVTKGSISNYKEILASKKEAPVENTIPENFIAYLKSQPESGMGYQVCDIELSDGTIFNDITIFNGSIAPKEIDTKKIKDIKISQKTPPIVAGTNEAVVDLSKNKENNISQAKINNVIITNDNNNSSMKLEKIEQLTDENLKSVKASDIQELFASTNKQLVEDGIKKISEDYTKQIAEKENLLKAANESSENLQKSVEAVKSDLEKIKSENQKLIEANKQREAVESFSARMETIEKGFDLDDKQKEIVANKVKTLTSDEEFNKYLEEVEVLLAAKKKGFVPFKKKSDPDKDGDDDKNKDGDTDKADDKKKEAKASVDDALKNGKPDEKNLLPNAGGKEESLAEKAKKAFGLDGWQVTDKRKGRK